MSTNAPASTNGSTWYVSLGGSPLDGCEDHSPDGDHPPERRQRQRRGRRDAPSSLVMSSCDQLPLTVSHMP